MAVTFPGLSNILRAEAVLTRGATPGTIIVLAVPQDTLQLGPGTLTIDSVTGGAAVLPDCLPVMSTLRKVKLDGGWVWSLLFYDHRWRWSCRTIGGEFNRRLPDGSIEESTRATPAQLVAQIFSQLGESADTSNMPSNVYPYVNWAETSCDLALAEVCQATLCECCGGEFGSAVIYQSGTGPDMPAGGVPLHAPGRTTRATPAQLTVVGGPQKYCHQLKLQAVGLEPDDEIKPIGSLSYAPGSGWGSELPGVFGGLTGANLIQAIKTVWRWYRVIGQSDGSLAVPGSSVTISNVNQYALLDAQAGVTLDASGGQQGLPPQIFGSFYNYGDVPIDESSGTEWLGGFVIDSARGIVIFPVPFFSMGSSQVPQEPVAALLTSYHVLTLNRGLEQLEVSAAPSGGAGATDIYRHRRPELFDCNNQGAQLSFGTNEANNYLALLQTKFLDNQLDDRSYAGVPNASLSGLVAQITVMGSCIGDEGFTTRVCRLEEMNPVSPSEQQRHRAEIVRRIGEERGL